MNFYIPIKRIPTVDDQRPNLLFLCGLVVKVIQLFKETASSRSMTTFWLIPVPPMVTDSNDIVALRQGGCSGSEASSPSPILSFAMCMTQ